MEYRQLGASDLAVSEISLGSWLTYGVGVKTQVARACLDRAFELGFNFIDTANVYGRGAAEEFLGEALAARDRSSYVLATKLLLDLATRDRVRGDPALRGKRDRADRVVAARAGRSHREVPVKQ